MEATRFLERPEAPGRARLFRGDVPRHPQRRILLLEPDPYLAFLVREHVPEADVIEFGSTDAPGFALAVEPDIVVVGLEALASNPIPVGSAVVVGVADGPQSETASPVVDGVLVRPFLPSEVRRILRAALHLPSDSRDAWARRRSVHVGLAYARLAAAALAAVIQASLPGTGHPAAILGFVFAYATIRMIVRDLGRVAAGADLIVAAGLLATTGGTSSAYAPFALSLVIGASCVLGLRAAPAAGAAVSLVALFGSQLLCCSAPASALGGLAWCVLFAGSAAATAFAFRHEGGGDGEGTRMLVEANRVLSTLYRVARAMPGGLDRGAIAAAAVAELRDILLAPGGAVLIGDAGAWTVADSFGFDDPGVLASRDVVTTLLERAGQSARVVRRSELPQRVGGRLGDHECFLVAPMRRAGTTTGVVVCVCPDEAHHAWNRSFLYGLAEETAVALENAHLFGRVRQFAIDEERQRHARELHDGVAQQLTHVRLELALIGRQHAADDHELKGELDRLARVVERAGREVREMINGLRSPVPPGGLAGSLRSYLQDLQGIAGPRITFDATGFTATSPDIELEVFRIAQEAVSNALQHAHAEHVHVTLSAGNGVVWLTVDDDGVGLHVGGTAARSGVGLAAMRERAEAIDGRVSIERLHTGGTRVRLAVPEPPAPRRAVNGQASDERFERRAGA